MTSRRCPACCGRRRSDRGARGTPPAGGGPRPRRHRATTSRWRGRQGCRRPATPTHSTSGGAASGGSHRCVTPRLEEGREHAERRAVGLAHRPRSDGVRRARRLEQRTEASRPGLARRGRSRRRRGRRSRRPLGPAQGRSPPDLQTARRADRRPSSASSDRSARNRNAIRFGPAGRSSRSSRTNSGTTRPSPAATAASQRRVVGEAQVAPEPQHRGCRHDVRTTPRRGDGRQRSTESRGRDRRARRPRRSRAGRPRSGAWPAARRRRRRRGRRRRAPTACRRRRSRRRGRTRRRPVR